MTDINNTKMCEPCRELQGASYVDEYGDLCFADQLDSYWSKGDFPDTYWKIAYKTESGDYGDYSGLQTWRFCSQEHADAFVSSMVVIEVFAL